MRISISFKDNYAATEIVGALILIVIAVIAFSAISYYLYPPPPNTKPLVKIEGMVNSQGQAVLKHMGGETINSYKIEVRYPNGSLIGTKEINDDNWNIGEKRYPCVGITDMLLSNESKKLWITVSTTDENGDEEFIFDGILKGIPTQHISPPPDEDAMLISSLRTNTIDEDLICFNHLIEPTINASSYIYNWLVNSNPLTDLHMTFNTNSTDDVKDYSGNSNDGTAFGPTWSSNGVIGGAYSFDGIDDYISIPYCFNGDYVGHITVETWIKTSSSSGVIASFDKDHYWELGVKDGKVYWSSTANGNNAEISSVSSVNDNNWHYIAVSYDYSNGYISIYIDGILDTSQALHNPGDIIGDATRPDGYIGHGSQSSDTTTILSTSFESQSEEDKWSKNDDRTTAYWWEFPVFNRLASDSLSPRTGSYSIGGTGNFDPRFAAFDREEINISQYSDVKVSVWYSYKSTENDDEIGFYYWDGDSWEPVFEELSPQIGNGNQLPWTYAEANIPESINNLTLQFWWSTSSYREYMAIDDLQITGVLESGLGNFSGLIDEFKIYNRTLTKEQIYQNYLCSKDGFYNNSVIVSDETQINDVWRCDVTPNDGNQDDTTVESNTLQIVNYGGG